MTRVASLCVDAHVAVWTRGGVLMTLIDVNTRDQEELVAGRALCSAPSLSVLTHVGSNCVHTGSPEVAIKKILFFTLEKNVIFLKNGFKSAHFI